MNNENNQNTINLDKDQFFSDISKSISDEIFSPIKQIYVDWTYLQDIYLGAMISLCKNKDDYAYLIENIDKYNDRVIRDHAYHFRKLFKSDIQLEKYIRVEDTSSYLLASSPFTNMFNNFKTMLHSSITRNLKLGYLEKIKVIVNMYPLVIGDIAQKIIKDIMKNCYLDVIKLGVVSEKISDIDLNLLTDSDILLIDRFDLFLADNTKTQSAWYTTPIPEFMDKAVITPKVIDNVEFISKLDTLSKEQIDEVFDNTETVMSICAQFKYISPIILLEDN